ncbi:MAG: cobalamin-binding protein [Pyrinomonadaceae bacterium]
METTSTSLDSQRIVSLLPSATEILCALGLEGSIIAVTHECDHPAGIEKLPHITSSRLDGSTMSCAEIDHAVRSQLQGHGSIYNLDEKLLEELKPDLIVTQELCEVCAVNYQMVKASARTFAADARILSLEPMDIAGILENIQTVGEFCDVPGRATEVVAELTERVELLRSGAAGKTKRPGVFMLEWLDPPFSPGHWVPEQVELAGGYPLLGKNGQKSVVTTYEAIAESNPEFLMLIPCGFSVAEIKQRIVDTELPRFMETVDAVRNDNIWALNASAYFSRPGPRVVDGAEILKEILDNGQDARLDSNTALNVSAEFKASLK